MYFTKPRRGEIIHDSAIVETDPFKLSKNNKHHAISIAYYMGLIKVKAKTKLFYHQFFH